jgi:glycerol-3-phosphate dehydrogenase
MDRNEMKSRLEAQDRPWDLLVIGGGATGVGVAVDAASRGYDVLLLEQSDFGKGTSSRSTKLIHGGVRYLQQGNIPLVMEALRERGILKMNAPHLVHDLAFVVPNYDWWEPPFYGIGLKVYDLLAGKYGFGASRILSRAETLERIPTLEDDDLRGGVLYHDGQFDDARLLIAMARTAARQGATLLNYARVVALTRSGSGFVDGAVFHDLESGTEHRVRARAVVNATGPFSDGVRRLDDPEAAPIIVPSQGVHLVLDGSFLPGDSAIMVPRTRDGRVLFAIPWYGRALVGTTDTPVSEAVLEPRALPEEIDFLLETAAQYLENDPTESDVKSVFVGIRPLVGMGGGSTAQISRDHTVQISGSGLLTIAGGKWTTWRHMAEDVVDQAATLADLEPRPCVTRQLPIHGYHRSAEKFGDLAVYGADAPAIADLRRADPELARRLHPALRLTAAEVVWGVRYEMARTVEDVLSRRSRSLLLDARAAIATAPEAARLMAQELGRDQEWEGSQVEGFRGIAAGYLLG